MSDIDQHQHGALDLLLRRLVRPQCVDDCVDGLKAIRRKNPKVIVLDLLLPRVNGFDVLRHLNTHTPEMLKRVIIATAATDSTYAGCKEIDSTHALIRKPIDIDRFCFEVVACHGGAAQARNAGTPERTLGPH